MDSTVIAAATISISPVGRSRFTVSSLRATTSPVTVITLSSRSASASAKIAVSGWKTTWVMPV